MVSQGFATICGVGAYIPQKVVSSEALLIEAGCQKYGIPENIISRSMGIKNRRFAANDESLAWLAYQASIEALNDANMTPEEIDLIIYCGIDRDRVEPATAHEVQTLLGAKRAEVYDASNACIGLLNGISQANAYIGIGSAENILVCTGEKPSVVTKDVIRQLRTKGDKSEFKRLLGAFTVGDAGGAFVLSKKQDDRGIQYMKFSSYGEYHHLCYYKHTPTHIEFEMHMEAVSNKGLALHQNMIQETYEQTGWSVSSLDKLFCHQVGERPHKKFASIAQQPLEKAPATYPEFGNLTSATFAVNMMLNPPKRGERVIFMGAGSGLTVCQMAINF